MVIALPSDTVMTMSPKHVFESTWRVMSCPGVYSFTMACVHACVCVCVDVFGCGCVLGQNWCGTLG
jgi:hypothetical protein